jgi:hypothetical protein
MKKLFAITFLLVSNLSLCQLKAVITNSETKERIPYVNIWVENENIGTTSNEKGEFELVFDGTKIIVFSAIGFKTKKISSDSIKKFIVLKPKIIELDEIVINSNKINKEAVIGNFKKSKVNHYFSCGKQPWITARFFRSEKEYNETPYLEKIKLLTNSDIKDAKFSIRLYSISENGEPDNYINRKNIIGIAKKGKKITVVDLSDLDIEFPKQGFFIAIEWLIIEENIHEYTYTMFDSKKKLKGISYEPSIGTVPSETDENSWIFNQGKWRRIWQNKDPNKKIRYSKKYRNKYSLIAIELSLTN